jgi:hypothetical protein
MPGYWTEDQQSMGYGVHLLWCNPQAADEAEETRQKHYGGRLMETVRVATVQCQSRPSPSPICARRPCARPATRARCRT